MKHVRNDYRTVIYAALAAALIAVIYVSGCGGGQYRNAPSPPPVNPPASDSPAGSTSVPQPIPGEYFAYTAEPENVLRWAEEHGYHSSVTGGMEYEKGLSQSPDADFNEDLAALVLIKAASGGVIENVEKLGGVFFAGQRYSFRAPSVKTEPLRMPSFLPNDPLYVEARLDDTTEPPTLIPYQKTTLEPVSAEGAWDLSRGAGVKIAIISSGVYSDHPDLAGRISPLSRSIREESGDIVTGTDVEDEPNTVAGAIGTYLAGIVAANANNGIGMAGIAPECELIVLKTGRVVNSPTPAWAMTDFEARAALRYAADSGAAAVLFPYAVVSTPQPQVLLEDAMNYCASANTLVIVPAGDGSPAIDAAAIYPANSEKDNVVSVGGLYIPTTVRLPNSNFDSTGAILDFGAPAFALIATDSRPEDPEANPPVTGYVYASGTPFAAVFAAGTAGLMAGALGDAKFLAQPMAAALRQSVDTWEYLGVSNPLAGAGRLNANRAAALAFAQVNVPAPLVISQVHTNPSQGANGTTQTPVYVLPSVLGGTPPYKVRIEWGDGSSFPPGLGAFSGYVNPVFSHSYISPGKYPVTIAFRDSAGQEKIHGLFYTIRHPLTATISATKNGSVPLQYLFKAVVVNADIANPSYKWDFDGNGTTDSTDQNPVYTYAAPGEYTAKFQATDSRGTITRTMVLSVQ